MTTYGTIPTATHESSDLEFVSRVNQRLRSRRPWKELVSLQSMSFPTRFTESLIRIRANVAYFQTNYAIVVLFLSLLWHPISLIVFVVMMAAWLFLYFLREEPLRIFNRAIGDRVVLIGLLVVTIVLLFLTHATLNIVVGMVVGATVVLVHAALRNVAADEEEVVVGARLALKETASSSFSSSP